MICNLCGSPSNSPEASTVNYTCPGCKMVTRHRAVRAYIDQYGNPTATGETIACYMREDEKKLVFRSEVKSLTNFDIRPMSGLIQMDIQDMSRFGPAQFDTLVAMHVMSCVRDDEKALAECARVLRPGGTFLVTVPFRVAGSTVPVEDITRDYGIENLERYGVGTYRIYGLEDWRAALRRHFQVINEFKYHDPFTGNDDIVFLPRTASSE